MLDIKSPGPRRKGKTLQQSPVETRFILLPALRQRAVAWREAAWIAWVTPCWRVPGRSQVPCSKAKPGESSDSESWKSTGEMMNPDGKVAQHGLANGASDTMAVPHESVGVSQ